LRGRKISCPRGQAVRPSTDRARQALFNILTSNFIEEWQGVRAVDLFAGTGALGLEAISRGAKACTFVEQDRKVVKVLEKNLLLAQATGSVASLVRADVYDFLQQKHIASRVGQVDLVLADPPYGKGHLIKLLGVLSRSGDFLSSRALMVFEGEKGIKMPEKYSGFKLLKSRNYGHSSLFFFRKE